MVINDTLAKLKNQVAALQSKIEYKPKVLTMYDNTTRNTYQRPTTNAFRNNQRIAGNSNVTGNISRQQTKKSRGHRQM